MIGGMNLEWLHAVEPLAEKFVQQGTVAMLAANKARDRERQKLRFELFYCPVDVGQMGIYINQVQYALFAC